ncbi:MULTISPECIES: hypothetical protein [unclassified Plantactinospora]|uniref:hypothetical protein n=1 Tax=unclassified Plantactinospora TaxID=2631981 RepID=UPI000D174B16|nr:MULTISPECIES: hypothetical protein [unclassified Plantactinospora]AVT33590.1 hypothetical protein C6361_33755 [Plantactinospora sp. BC1]AVT39552.1 hypothetical protein C6W10_27420 [Plantactinospora sp. BB1]
MAGEVSRRLVGVATLLIAAASWLGIAGAAQAKPARPTSVVITGKDLATPVTIRAQGKPELFAALLDQVGFLKTGPGNTGGPKAADLGPKYTMVVHVGDAAQQSYDLYPLAKGGPRVYRPARQPDKSRPGAAWFFGRLTMAEALLAAGAPLPEQTVTSLHGGGIGGGERVIPDDAIGTGKDVDRLLGELRQLMLLNGAVLLAITLGLAGIALLVRRRTR